MDATSLDEYWIAYSIDHVDADASAMTRVLQKRAFMSGALACLALQKAGRNAEVVMAELVQFGRAVGSAAEGV